MSLRTVVLDVEAVPNEAAIRRLEVLRPTKSDVGEDPGWPRWILHRIVAAAVLAVTDSTEAPTFELRSYTVDRDGEAGIIAKVEAHLEQAHALVTYNGTAYDLPLLRARAMAHRSLPVPRISSFVGARSAKHTDLALSLAGGASASRPSLAEVAAVLDLPSKSLILGTSVPELAAAGEYARVGAHCETDVLTTWLASMHGWITDRGAVEPYLERLQAARDWLSAEGDRPHLGEYVKACHRLQHLLPADPPLPFGDATLRF